MNKNLKNVMMAMVVAIMSISCEWSEEKVSLLKSCGKDQEIVELVKKYDAECPMAFGETGTVNSVSYEDNSLVIKISIHGTAGSVSTLQSNKEETKEMICMSLSKDSNKRLTKKMIEADIDLKVLFSDATGERTSFKITAKEMKKALEKFSKMSEEEKIIVNGVFGTKINLPLQIDDITTLTNLSITAKDVVYYYDIDDMETERELRESVNFMKVLTISQISHSIKNGFEGNKNRQFYKALVKCHQGVKVKYHGVNTGKNANFNISVSELRDILNGEYDDLPTMEEWEDFTDALDDL